MKWKWVWVFTANPASKKEAIKPDAIVDELLDKILSDMKFEGEEVAVLVNGLGATPLMELFIVNKRVNSVLTGKGIKIYKTLVGNYMTAIEMAGFSVSVLKLDPELKELLDAKADTPSYKS